MSKPLFKVNVSTVIVKDDRFLMVKRADDEEVFPGFWGIPGGTVELSDTSLEAALVRECEEEIGVKVVHPRLISNDIHSNGETGALYLVYQAQYDSGEPRPLDGTAEVKWLRVDEIRTLELTPKTLEMIEVCHRQSTAQ